MKVSENPEQLLKKITSRALILIFGISILDTLLIATSKAGCIDSGVFSILIAPPIEEALKAGLAFLLGVFLLSHLSARESMRFDLVKIFALASVASGVVFALDESLAQGEPLGTLLTGLYVHSILTSGVGIGCLSLILGGNERFLATIFPLAVAGHASWNYLVLHSSPVIKTVMLAIFITIIALTTWRYLDLQSEGSTRPYDSFLETA